MRTEERLEFSANVAAIRSGHRENARRYRSSWISALNRPPGGETTRSLGKLVLPGLAAAGYISLGSIGFACDKEV
jgi:hypothetical protein